MIRLFFSFKQFEPSKVDKEIKSLEKKPTEKTVEEPSVTPPAPSSKYFLSF